MYSNLLMRYRIANLYHVAPLHYLVYIARSKFLYSKSKLIDYGYGNSHFRSTSKNADINRGFKDVVHCTNNPFPPILLSKLSKGYQHFEICLPADELSEEQYLLCKYNIAKNRGLFTESLATGKRQHGYEIPVAISLEEKNAMLSAIDLTSHFEILVSNMLSITDSATFRFFSEVDAQIASNIFAFYNARWKIHIADCPCPYFTTSGRQQQVTSYISSALNNPDWRGNGLEYDR